MANKINNNVLAATLVVAIVISVVGMFLSMGNVLTGRASGTTSVTVTQDTACSLVTSAVAFGSLANDASNDTTNDSPAPFSIQNDGNANVNVSVNSGGGGYTSLWDSQSAAEEDGGAYQWACSGNQSGSCANGDIDSLTNIGDGTAQQMVHALVFADNADQCDLDIKITVPSDEQSGAKSDTITFTCSAA